jgi:protein-S-isoprenylcysteine O-methyltransferase Ste14
VRPGVVWPRRDQALALIVALAVVAMLWYVPVIGTTAFVHVFIDCWRAYGSRSYYIFSIVFGLTLFGTALALPPVVDVRLSIPPSLRVFGISLFVLALAFMAWSYKTLTFKTLVWFPEVRQNLRTEACFVARGPYRICRHPVYSAALAILVAVFLVSGILIVWLPVIMLLGLTVIEDSELRARFGMSYETYAQSTPALLGPKALRRVRPRK